jgi:hypothetical protein
MTGTFTIYDPLKGEREYRHLAATIHEGQHINNCRECAIARHPAGKGTK